jgi:hypothetical protein
MKKYIQLGRCWRTTFCENIRAPPVKLPQGIFAKIACDFQMICFYSYPEFVMGGFSFQVELMFSIFRLGLFYNKVLLDTVI